MTTILSELREAYQALEGAETRADVGRVYETLAGYDIAADQPDADMETLREYVGDYIAEVCYEYGIHILDVTGESVSDEARANGPRA